MRRTIALVAVMLSSCPADGDPGWAPELPELVGRADRIVFGTAVPGGGDPKRPESYTIRVTEVLLGPAAVTLTVPPPWRGGFGPDPAVYFVSDLPTCTADPANRADEVRRLAKLKTDLKAGVADLKTAFDPGFLSLLGYATAGKEPVGGLTRAEAVAHLRKGLARADETVALVAVRTLWLTGDKTSAAAVVPLLDRSEQSVRRLAAAYLGKAGDRLAVAPLCDVLDALGDDPHNLLESVTEALDRIGDSAAAPALVRGIRAGHNLGRVLGRVGDERHVSLLLGRPNVESTYSVDGLRNLVARSNVPVEEWMGQRSDEKETARRWRAWWADNRDRFKVVKTAAEADRGPQGGPSPAPPPRPKSR